MDMKTTKLAGASILSAIAASLCCITPILALISGASGAASAFSWLEPYRPLLIGITVAVLGFAWYQKLKPKQESIDCNCEQEEKTPFMQTKTFLAIVTIFAAVMTAFPYYSAAFYPDNQKKVVVSNQLNVQKIDLGIKGMTCEGCEEHIKHAVNELPGIIHVDASFKDGSTSIEFDQTKTSLSEIEKAIDKTGYIVQGKLNINDKN